MVKKKSVLFSPVMRETKNKMKISCYDYVLRLHNGNKVKSYLILSHLRLQVRYKIFPKMQWFSSSLLDPVQYTTQ